MIRVSLFHMGTRTLPEPGAFAAQLAHHARYLQAEARDAFARGEFTRASALIGDAELLAEDVHELVRDMERREIGVLAMLAAYDVRPDADAVFEHDPAQPASPTRRLRMAIAASLTMSLALVEW